MKNKCKKLYGLIFLFGIIFLCLSFSIVCFDNHINADTTFAVNGGAVYIKNGATYTKNGGTISNKSGDKGGAVYVGNGATFIMNGGIITNCSATDGGAIYVASGGKCYLNGGTITNCSSTISGNAVCVEEGGYLELSDGFVIENCGMNFVQSIKAINPFNVKRSVEVTPYVDGVVQTPIKTYTNETVDNIGLPNQDGCGWYEESVFNNSVLADNAVGAYAETSELSLYFSSHNWSTVARYYGSTCTTQGGSLQRCSVCSAEQELSSGGYYGNHVYNYYVALKSVAPTCEEDGYDYWECNWCYAYITTTVIKKGHNYQSTVTSPTCTEQGYTTYNCSRCSSSYNGNYVDATGHGDTTMTTGHTSYCTTSGYIEYACKICLAVVSTSKYSSHSTSSYTSVAATCSSTGTQITYCTRSSCSYSTSSTIAKNSSNHSSTSTYTSTITKATCSSTGTKGTYRSCCDALISTSTIAIDSSNHSSARTYTSTITAATCTSTGTKGTYRACCDALVSTSTLSIDSSNHSSTSTYTSTITAATCTSTGTKGTYRSCCDALVTTSSIPINSSNHNYKIPYQGADEYVCTRCGATKPRTFSHNEKVYVKKEDVDFEIVQKIKKIN